MSHELRTPLNSLLILSKLLLDNESGNLTAKQIDFARTIRAAGSDLLELINDILDLSKIEAGKMDLLLDALPLADVCAYVRRTFEPVAADKGLTLDIVLDDGVPHTIVTDEQRLQQILRNLLSNAFKFTAEGGVTLRIERAGEDVARVLGDRHRHRDRPGEARRDLRGLPAGRRHDQPHVRRHRPRAVDQPRARTGARRRDQRREHAPGSGSVFTLSLRLGRRLAARRDRFAARPAGRRSRRCRRPLERSRDDGRSPALRRPPRARRAPRTEPAGCW